MPFSAAQIAREAGLSREWVAKARKGNAYKIGWDTAQRIHAAIDALAERASPQSEPVAAPAPQHHPGLKLLAADKPLCSRRGFTADLIRQVSGWTTGDTPIITKEQAIRMCELALSLGEPAG